MKTLKWLIVSLLATAPLVLFAQNYGNIGSQWDNTDERRLNRFNPNVDPTIKIRNAWIAPTVEGQDVAAAYMTIETPVTASLISIYCPIAQRVEFHETIKDAESAFKRTRPIKYPITFSPSFVYKLEPNGKRILLIGLKQPLKLGDKVPFTLQLKSSMYNNTTNAAITTMIPVRNAPTHVAQPQDQTPQNQTPRRQPEKHY